MNETGFCMETVKNGSRLDYYLTYEKGAEAAMIFRHKYYLIREENGWIKEEYERFMKAEFKDRKVLLYYWEKKEPEVLDAPLPARPGSFDLVEETVRQIKEEGKSFDDFWEEYYNGTNTVYSYDSEKKCFKVTYADIIAASFLEEEELSPEALKAKLGEIISFYELREQGFNL